MGKWRAHSTMDRAVLIPLIAAISIITIAVDAEDTNLVFDPCSDTKIQKGDGFSFGLAFSTKESFFFQQIQLSPCDNRLPLAGSSAQLAVYRPKVDEISLLTINSSTFNPVLEFQKGTLQNLYWKKFGCDSCPGDSTVCLNNEDCAVPNSKCSHAGACNIGIQLTFSGTDKNDVVLNSWYEVKNLRRYSLYGLYSDLRDTITNPSQNMF
ncbi:hypothetical protein EUGRSUZ_G01513 [Eucalyptus grandis]|uniref:Uncharacterized protein n=2 Tax=Eucalyptus grandis TaxID=71139 RepID=A0ACC3K599_EUCGR|nr:hypothetical protein EUGRSUZ_G01513 [Eucalyptus grandis]